MALSVNDIKMLSPDAQRQIAEKLGERARQEEQQNKYRNKPTMRDTPEGKLRFDSAKEARRYDELMLMLQAGQIRELRLQQQFTLQEAYTTPEGQRVRAIRYQADFCYEKSETTLYDHGKPVGHEWRKVVEDVKSSATKTRVYAIKKKLMREKYNIEIQEV